MKESRRQAAVWIAALAALSFAGCERSTAYRKDQEYYTQDSEFAAKKASAASRAARFGQPKKKIFVYPFWNDTPFMPENGLGEFSSAELTRELRSGAKAVVPEDLRAGGASQDFYSGAKIRLGPLLREGKRLGVAIVVLGKIKRIVYRRKGDEVGLFRKKKSVATLDLEMRAFSVADNKELLFTEKSADSESNQVDLFGGEEQDPRSQRLELVKMALRNGMRAFAADLSRLLDKISWEGRVAKVSGGRFYINAGRLSGLSLGDILKVLSPGEDIYDHATNAYLGRSQGQVKGTLEITDYVGSDGAVAVLQSGGGILENDVVQLY